MIDQIPARVTRLFDSEKARPMVIRVYDANKGWAAAAGTPVITWSIVDELLQQGVTSVEVKWRFRTHQFSILGMKRPVQGDGVDDTDPGIGQTRGGGGSQN